MRPVSISLAQGDEGVRVTVGYMRQMIREAMFHPEVRALAAKIVSGISPADLHRRAHAILAFTRQRFEFVADTVGAEELEAPHIHVARILGPEGRTYGDCDDLTMLQAALLHAVGIPARIATTGRGQRAAARNLFNHVGACGLLGDNWYSLDWLPISKLPPFRVGMWDLQP